jgi:hypothetical protein
MRIPPVRIDPRWYEEYWLNGRRARHRWGLLALLAWLGLWLAVLVRAGLIGI